jgi:cbb3-type cytochrome oxidase maturation protein
MNILLVLIPLSLILLGLGIAAFFWAVRNDQFEDLDSPAWKILLDDDSRPNPELPERNPEPDSPQDSPGNET